MWWSPESPLRKVEIVRAKPYNQTSELRQRKTPADAPSEGGQTKTLGAFLLFKGSLRRFRVDCGEGDWPRSASHAEPSLCAVVTSCHGLLVLVSSELSTKAGQFSSLGFELLVRDDSAEWP